jgi:hypothetical protein
MVSRSSTEMVRLRGSASRFNSGKSVTIGSETDLIKPRSIAMPTRAAITLLDTDLMFASRERVQPAE